MAWRTKAEARDYNKKYRAKNRRKLRKAARVYRRANPAICMLANKRAQCKAAGIEFNLSLADLLPLPTFCPIFGMKLDYGRKKHVLPNSPSIDRIRPEKGYVKGNIAVISHLANTIKGTGSIAQHEAVIAYMRKHDVV